MTHDQGSVPGGAAPLPCVMSQDALYVCAASWYRHFTALLSPVRMAFSQWSNWFSYKSWFRSRGTCRDYSIQSQWTFTTITEELQYNANLSNILTDQGVWCTQQTVLANNQSIGNTGRSCCPTIPRLPAMQASLQLILDNSTGQACSYLLILIVEGAPHLKAGVLVGIMYDDVVAVPSDVHCTEELRAMKQQGVTEAAYRPICHLEDCHGGSVIPTLHRDLCNGPDQNSNHLFFRKITEDADSADRVDRLTASFLLGPLKAF